jgi:tetratricopeptide (TPR) repeat protein
MEASATVAAALLLSLSFGLASCASPGTVAKEQKSRPPETPASPSLHEESHLIPGVPFVKWGDAAQLNYSKKATQNPSYAAASAMILEYWGSDRKELEGRRDPMKEWRNESKSKPTSLEGIKRLIDREIPVLVCPAMTPYAHRQYLGLAIWMAMKKAGVPNPTGKYEATVDQFRLMVRTAYGFETEGPASGAFGVWLPLESYQALGKLGAPVMNDSIAYACRVVIGYDDARRVLILHDPTLGPAWEVDYDDFWKLWNFVGDPWYIAPYPANYVQILAKKGSAQPYVRSADNEAAVHYVYGYAWQSIGQSAKAESEYRQGLALSGVGLAYSHLLNMDLAVTLAALGRPPEALPYARRATELMPQDSRAWQVLAKILSSGGGEATDAKREAADAEGRARTLCSDEYEREVAAALAQDFSLLSCKEEGNVYLLWGVATGMSTTGAINTYLLK